MTLPLQPTEALLDDLWLDLMDMCSLAGVSEPWLRERLGQGLLSARTLSVHDEWHDFMPDPIHAGGLRYHGMSPLISHLYEEGLIEAEARTQKDCFAAGVLFARTEGIVPAPEPTHALAAAVDEAIRCIETGEEKVILTALCGHGHLDLPAYDAYLRGDLVDHTWEDTELQEAVAQALTKLPSIPG